ncbi:MAG: hypothetical protein JOZ25_00520 [Actinobacteria bacterium]|nr:hypothetical protein [Actinomycetota bacterium]
MSGGSLRAGLAALCVIAALLAAPVAALASPTDDIYGGTLGNVQSTTQRHDPNRGLPFTGLDVGIVVLAGAFLVGTGLAVRRASRTT